MLPRSGYWHVSKSLWPICPGFSFLHKQNWPFKIGLTTFWASLHCVVQSVTSEWSVSFQVSWLELLGLRKLVTDTFEQSCCGTPTLTSVSQQPFYSYYPSLWRVTTCVWIFLVCLDVWRLSLMCVCVCRYRYIVYVSMILQLDNLFFGNCLLQMKWIFAGSCVRMNFFA